MWDSPVGRRSMTSHEKVLWDALVQHGCDIWTADCASSMKPGEDAEFNDVNVNIKVISLLRATFLLTSQVDQPAPAALDPLSVAVVNALFTCLRDCIDAEIKVAEFADFLATPTTSQRCIHAAATATYHAATGGSFGWRELVANAATDVFGRHVGVDRGLLGGQIHSGTRDRECWDCIVHHLRACIVGGEGDLDIDWGSLAVAPSFHLLVSGARARQILAEYIDIGSSAFASATSAGLANIHSTLLHVNGKRPGAMTMLNPLSVGSLASHASPSLAGPSALCAASAHGTPAADLFGAIQMMAFATEGTVDAFQDPCVDDCDASATHEQAAYLPEYSHTPGVWSESVAGHSHDDASDTELSYEGGDSVNEAESGMDNADSIMSPDGVEYDAMASTLNSPNASSTASHVAAATLLNMATDSSRSPSAAPANYDDDMSPESLASIDFSDSPECEDLAPYAGRRGTATLVLGAIRKRPLQARNMDEDIETNLSEQLQYAEVSLDIECEKEARTPASVPRISPKPTPQIHASPSPTDKLRGIASTATLNPPRVQTPRTSRPSSSHSPLSISAGQSGVKLERANNMKVFDFVYEDFGVAAVSQMKNARAHCPTRTGKRVGMSRLPLHHVTVRGSAQSTRGCDSPARRPSERTRQPHGLAGGGAPSSIVKTFNAAPPTGITPRRVQFADEVVYSLQLAPAAVPPATAWLTLGGDRKAKPQRLYGKARRALTASNLRILTGLQDIGSNAHGIAGIGRQN